MTLNTKREFLEIWQEFDYLFPWRVQLVNYVGKFPSEEKAKVYVAMVQEHISRAKKATR